jgi:hypothetical protein
LPYKRHSLSTRSKKPFSEEAEATVQEAIDIIGTIKQEVKRKNPPKGRVVIPVLTLQ